MLSALFVDAYANTQFFVQIAEKQSQKEAEEYWQSLKTEYPAVLDQYGYRTRVIAGLGTDAPEEYRVQAGPVRNRVEAERVCAKLMTKSIECFIVETAFVEPDIAPRNNTQLALPGIGNIFGSSSSGNKRNSAVNVVRPSYEPERRTGVATLETQDIPSVNEASTADEVKVAALEGAQKSAQPAANADTADNSLLTWPDWLPDITTSNEAAKPAQLAKADINAQPAIEGLPWLNQPVADSQSATPEPTQQAAVAEKSASETVTSERITINPPEPEEVPRQVAVARPSAEPAALPWNTQRSVAEPAPTVANEAIKGRVRVAEAIRVPVKKRVEIPTGTPTAKPIIDNSAPPVMPKPAVVVQQEIKPLLQRQNKDDLWLSIGSFERQVDAFAFSRQLQSSINRIDPKLRMRVTRSLTAATETAAIRIGPIYDTNKAAQICGVVNEKSDYTLGCGSAIDAPKATAVANASNPINSNPVVTHNASATAAAPQAFAATNSARAPIAQVPARVSGTLPDRPAAAVTSTTRAFSDKSQPVKVSRQQQIVRANNNATFGAPLTKKRYLPQESRYGQVRRGVDQNIAVSRALPALSPASSGFNQLQTFNQYWVQLGSAPNKARAVRQWEAIKEANSTLLQPYQPTYTLPQRASIGAKPFVRLRVGPFRTQTGADNLCAKLSVQDVGCLVISQ